LVALKFLVGLLVLIVLVVFALQNLQPDVVIEYYFDKKIGPMPFSFALLGAAVLGSIIAALVTLCEQIKLRSVIRRQRKQIVRMEAELLEFKRRPPEPLPEKVISGTVEGGEIPEAAAAMRPAGEE